MSEHKISIDWKRGQADFVYQSYSRDHTITFSPTGTVCGSAAPEFRGNAQCLNPEQAFISAMSSCHMLTFLAIAAKQGFTVDAYHDEATGMLGKNPDNVTAVVRISLKPVVAFSGPRVPTDEQFSIMHQQAHEQCFIANSVAKCVEVIVEATRQTV